MGREAVVSSVAGSLDERREPPRGADLDVPVDRPHRLDEREDAAMHRSVGCGDPSRHAAIGAVHPVAEGDDAVGLVDRIRPAGPEPAALRSALGCRLCVSYERLSAAGGNGRVERLETLPSGAVAPDSGHGMVAVLAQRFSLDPHPSAIDILQSACPCPATSNSAVSGSLLVADLPPRDAVGARVTRRGSAFRPVDAAVGDLPVCPAVAFCTRPSSPRRRASRS